MLKNNKNLPKLFISRSKLENILELISIILIIFFIYYSLTILNVLPYVIPTRFDYYGNITSWSNKNILWLSTIIMICVYILLTVLLKFPYKFNYIVKINENNAFIQYKLVRIWLLSLKIEIIILFFITHWIIVSKALNKHLPNKILVIFHICALIIILGTVGIYIYKSNKTK